MARAEAAERGARELEAKVEQLERLQKEQQGRTEAARRTNGDEALAKNALLQVEVNAVGRLGFRFVVAVEDLLLVLGLRQDTPISLTALQRSLDCRLRWEFVFDNCL